MALSTTTHMFYTGRDKLYASKFPGPPIGGFQHASQTRFLCACESRSKRHRGLETGAALPRFFKRKRLSYDLYTRFATLVLRLLLLQCWNGSQLRRAAERG